MADEAAVVVPEAMSVEEAGQALGQMTPTETVETPAPAETTVPTEDGDDFEGLKPKLDPKHAEVFEKRLGKEVGKRKELEENLQTVSKERDELKAKLEGDTLPRVLNQGVAPEYLSGEDAKTVAEYDRWREVQDFCNSHGGGYEAPAGGRSFTADEITEWKARAMDALLEVAPEARQIRRRAMSQMARDLELGRRMRVEQEKARKTGAAQPPKPGTPGPGAAALPGTPAPRRAGVDERRFESAGADRAAAARELSELVPAD